MSRLLLAIGLGVIGIASARAGVLFEIEMQDRQQNPPRTITTRVAVEGRRLAMDLAPGQNSQRGGTVLFQGESRQMAILNHEDKSFFIMDTNAIKQLTGQVNSAMGQMQEAMRNVPENQRAAFEQMMKSKMPAQPKQQGPLEVRQTNQTANVYGYPCQLVEVRRDGRKIRDIWVTDWNNIDSGRELAPIFADLGDFQQELMSAVPQMPGRESAMEDNAFTTMKQIGGFPVASRDYAEDGSVKSETALRSAKSQRMNPALFDPPAGYQRREMFGAGAVASPPATVGGRYTQPAR